MNKPMRKNKQVRREQFGEGAILDAVVRMVLLRRGPLWGDQEHVMEPEQDLAAEQFQQME